MSNSALLEGIAAFTIEGEDMFNEWSRVRNKGKPGKDAVSAFRDTFNSRLIQAQFGSRLGDHATRPSSKLKRTNILTLLEKFEKKIGIDSRAFMRRVPGTREK